MTKLVGCSGSGLPREGYRQELEFFELRDTFVSPPKSKTLERWRESVGADFVFAIRAWQVITHESTCPSYKLMAPGIREAMRNGGHFRECGEIRDAWAQTLRAAEALRARVIVFETPASFTPTSRNRSQMTTFFESIERPDNILLVWDPQGLWAAHERRTLCSDLGLVEAANEDELSSVERGYLRLQRASYDEDQLLRIADATYDSAEMYYAFLGPQSVHLAKRLQRLVGESVQ